MSKKMLLHNLRIMLFALLSGLFSGTVVGLVTAWTGGSLVSSDSATHQIIWICVWFVVVVPSWAMFWQGTKLRSNFLYGLGYGLSVCLIGFYLGTFPMSLILAICNLITAVIIGLNTWVDYDEWVDDYWFPGPIVLFAVFCQDRWFDFCDLRDSISRRIRERRKETSKGTPQNPA